MFLELLTSIVVFIGVLFFVSKEIARIETWVVGTVVFLSLVLSYWYVYKSTRIEITKDNFKQVVFKLNRLFSIYEIYIRICIVLLPLGFVLGYSMSWLSREGNSFMDSRFWIPLVIALPFVLLLWFPAKWLINNIYGQYIVELKALVAELQEKEE
jgi:Zn-dependent protease with chaperone function